MKFRHECKHRINLADITRLRTRLEAVAERDPHSGEDGTYLVKSLYFDNYKDKVLREKTDGVNNREKFRIRYYGSDTSFMRLEKKLKIGGLCSKESTPITAEECRRIMDGDTEKAAEELIKAEAKKSLLRSKSVTKSGIELTYEVRVRESDTDFVNKISDCEGVSNAVLVSYNGEYMS